MWVWKIASGQLWHYDQYSATGYSGRGAGLNNPSMQNCHGVEGKEDAGPIPVGSYTIGSPVDSHGGYALPLSPWPDNDMHGRGSFLIHGGMKNEPSPDFGFGSASLGCIILSRPMRQVIWEGADHSIKVVEA